MFCPWAMFICGCLHLCAYDLEYLGVHYIVIDEECSGLIWAKYLARFELKKFCDPEKRVHFTISVT
ncbi:hypothetical protein M758_1G190800 [Ceratodon purpureus]|nr:hypothetical protein M758_1G190800 [Ceratodon purpureus]